MTTEEEKQFVKNYPDIRKNQTKKIIFVKRKRKGRVNCKKKKIFVLLLQRNSVIRNIQINPNRGRVEIYIGKQLKEAISKLPDFNLSAFVRQKLKEYLESKGIEIKEPEPDLLLLVKCPYCNSKFVTSSVKTVQCKWCGKFFKVYRKRGISRIVKIVKGNRMLLWRKIS